MLIMNIHFKDISLLTLMHFSLLLELVAFAALSDDEDLDDDSKEVIVNEDGLEDEDPKIP